MKRQSKSPMPWVVNKIFSVCLTWHVAFDVILYEGKNSEIQVKFKPNLDLFDKKTYICGCNQDIQDIKEEQDMRTSAAMENLWLYLQSLPKSNKKWLSEKLIEDLSAKEEETISKEEILAGIDRGLKEMVERKRTGRKAKTLEELINEL